MRDAAHEVGVGGVTEHSDAAAGRGRPIPARLAASGRRTVPRPGHAGVAAVVLATLSAGCAGPGPSARPARRPEPRTAAALVKVAQRFNNDYGANDDAPVYARFDARSRALISESAYLRRHRECPTAPGRAVVEGAAPGPSGSWLVRYEIDGVQLVDHWFYRGGRWVFDLPLSNPSAVRLYKMPFARYAAAVGCSAR